MNRAHPTPSVHRRDRRGAAAASRAPIALVLAAILGLVASCIVSDQLTTVTIRPDGSADWVRFQSDIRSTEAGEKGKEEMAQFAADFEAGRDADVARIRDAGGEIVESRWVRRDEPCATLVVARFPHAAALESFFTHKSESGETLVRTTFTRDGERRRLTLAIRLPQEEPPKPRTRPTDEEQRQARADGVSETRIAVSGGRITAARGFTIASDKRSALLDSIAIEDLLHAGDGAADVFLEWELLAAAPE